VSLGVAKLRWRCRRGMKELDLLLLNCLERRHDTASEEERWIFSELLELPDPKLHAYLLGREQPAVHAIADVARAIRHADRPTRAGWLSPSMLSMKLSTGFAEDRRTP
jgi:antitoxin CptB